jgi:RNA-directed DNA polymerase
MSMRQAMRQMPAQAGRVGVTCGEAARRTPTSDEACCPRHESGDTGSALLEAALTGENLKQAFKRVRSNKGAAGVDGLDVDQTSRHLVTAWPAIREQLLKGTYRPSPVRRVTIPKPDGGERELGIPTVTDRLIQQALLLMVQPVLDPAFSEHSTGCRSGWRAHDPYLPRSRTCSRLGGS